MFRKTLFLPLLLATLFIGCADDSRSLFEKIEDYQRDAPKGAFSIKLYGSASSDQWEPWPDSVAAVDLGDGIKELSFYGGYRSSASIMAQVRHAHPFRYIDFDTDAVLTINDEEAINQNTSWDLGIRYFDLMSNGNHLPGNLEVARVSESADQKTFEAFGLDDAKGLEDSRFMENDSFDEATGKPLSIYVGGSYGVLWSTFGALNSDQLSLGENSPFDYDGDSHTPKARPGYFYLLRDKTNPSWFVKMSFKEITYNRFKNYVTYKLHYKKL